MKVRKDQFNVFERIESVKEILMPVCPDKNSFQIRALVMRCVKFRVGQAKKLTKAESMTYDLLLKHKIAPKTAYMWMLLEQCPPELRAKLEANAITLIDAHRQLVQWKRLSGSQSGQDIMDEMRIIIRRLQWRSQENINSAT